MGLFIMFIIWYNLWGKQNPKIYRAIDGKIGAIFAGIIALGILTSLIPVIATLLIELAGVFAPIFFVVWLISEMTSGKNKRRKDAQFVKQRYQAPNNVGGRMKETFTGLTKSIPKRRKIVEKFNKKYSLNLTPNEVATIVDASFMSFAWEREIYDMSQDFNSPYEWYNSETGWLRAYLRVFAVQNVSSDFQRQMQICLESFNQIFEEIDPSRFGTTEECIRAINNTYYTAFDESTFMIAYRFLRDSGKKYPLPRANVVSANSEINDLMDKYDKAGNQYGNMQNGQYANQFNNMQNGQYANQFDNMQAGQRPGQYVNPYSANNSTYPNGVRRN